MAQSSVGNLPVIEVRQHAKDMAEAILQEHWPDGQFPVDPAKIADALGVEVFNAQLGNDVWGMFLRTPGGAPRIFVDEDQPTNRWRFSCAHEIGHFIERGARLEDDDIAFVDKRTDSNPFDPVEIYANEFAANILMPERDVRARVKVGLGPIQIASEMGVSLDAMRYRFSRLGIAR